MSKGPVNEYQLTTKSIAGMNKCGNADLCDLEEKLKVIRRLHVCRTIGYSQVINQLIYTHAFTHALGFTGNR